MRRRVESHHKSPRRRHSDDLMELERLAAVWEDPNLSVDDKLRATFADTADCLDSKVRRRAKRNGEK